MLRKWLGVLIIFSVLAMGPSYSSAAVLPPAIGLDWSSEPLGVGNYTFRTPISDKNGNVVFVYAKPTNEEDMYPNLNSYIVMNSGGKVLTHQNDFKNRSNIKNIRVLKDGVVVTQGDYIKKIDFQGKVLWSKLITIDYNNVWIADSGNVFAYSNGTIYKLNPKDGKTNWSYKAPLGVKFNPKTETFIINETGYISAVKENKKIWRVAAQTGYKYHWLAEISSNGTFAVINTNDTSEEALLQVLSSSGKLKWKRSFPKGLGSNEIMFNGKDYLFSTNTSETGAYFWYDPNGKVVSTFKANDNDGSYGFDVFSITDDLSVYGHSKTSTSEEYIDQHYYQKISKTGVVLAETKVLSPNKYFTSQYGLLNLDFNKGKMIIKNYKQMENPVMPTNGKAATAGYDRLKISWTPVKDVVGYEIFRAASINGTYSKAATISNGNTTSYTNSGLITGKSYYYKIRAIKRVGATTLYSSYSSTISGKPLLQSLSSVKSFSGGYNKVKVSWAKVSGASGYEIYRSTSKGGNYSRVGSVNASGISYINSNLTTAKTYYYKVKAYRTVNGTKVYGSYSSITAAKPILPIPTSLKVAKASKTSLKVTWKKSNDASGYAIYRSSSKTGSYKKVATITSGKTVSYTNKSLKKGKRYYYKIRAYHIVEKNKVYSSYSGVVSGKL